MNQTHLLSFVIPVKDEEETIHVLHGQIVREVQALGHDYEFIFIDDGSSDSSWSQIQALSEIDHRVSGIKFRRNIGKANALTAGFEAARGDIVFTLDADLQDDPKEIGRFLAKLDEGFDLVSGWKQTRHDPWHKVLPSRVFNRMISKLIGVDLHDHNCGFKCYRAQVVKDVSLYGEMHRMVPSLASLHGYRSSEIAVQHHPRLHGTSKYGVKRFLRGFMDMLTVYFLKHFKERPLHLFGGVAIVFALAGALIFALAATGICDADEYGVGAILFALALPLAAVGFLAELLISQRAAESKNLPISATVGGRGQPSAEAIMINSHVEEAPLVLIVDDDARMRSVHRMYLADAGFRVNEASNGIEAIEKVTDDTSIVVMDLSMPGGGGIEALRVIRSRFAGIKVIMASGHDEAGGAVAAMKLGAFDYLTKPVSCDHLIATVSRAAEAQSMAQRHLAHA